MDIDNLPGALRNALIGATLLQLDNGQQVAAVPDDYALTDLETFRDNPNRITNTINVNGLDSFLGYVNRFKGASSTIFITPDLTQLATGAVLATAYLDYHAAASDATVDEALPSWMGHRVELFAQPSLPYAKLLNLDGKLLTQPEFAQALEDIARFSSSHPAAELVEIARTISLASKGDFKSFEDELSGSVDFRFDMAVRASAGTQERRLSVPSIIDFKIPLIDGLTPVGVQAKFLYRVPEQPGGKVLLGVKIVDRVWIEQAAVSEAKEMVAEGTKLPVYVGRVK